MFPVYKRLGFADCASFFSITPPNGRKLRQHLWMHVYRAGHRPNLLWGRHARRPAILSELIGLIRLQRCALHGVRFRAALLRSYSDVCACDLRGTHCSVRSVRRTGLHAQDWLSSTSSSCECTVNLKGKPFTSPH
ncbi:hypothetical protein BDZ89DRAFT_159130 [Hymenopellis radicata]|nr:hypothetical protein BDZ89DRAFT_159130 [Hymenopellis radicata]